MTPRIELMRGSVRGRSPLRIRMTARAVDEPHRASTQLELLFDLTFVVAVAAVVAHFGHGLDDGHAVALLAPFLQVFFAIWWAWMNFTWFASSYDTDDVPYRLLVLLQMGGVLVLAAGVPSAIGAGDYRGVTLGYLLMRLALVLLWLRAAWEDPLGRRTALRYAAGISVVEVLWLIRLVLAEAGILLGAASVTAFVVLVIAELAVPVWAERNRRTTWHPRHIAERYALFTIILLGESVLAVSRGVADVLESGLRGPSVLVATAGLVLLFGLWWLAELESSADGLSTRRGYSFLWGYGHYGIFAALAALGAGLEVAVRRAGAADTLGTAYTVAVPTAAFLILLWVSHAPILPRSPFRPSTALVAGILVLLAPMAGAGAGVGAIVAAIALIVAGAVAASAFRARSGFIADG